MGRSDIRTDRKVVSLMSYYAAKVLGQVFANPRFYFLRCLVANESGVVNKGV